MTPRTNVLAPFGRPPTPAADECVPRRLEAVVPRETEPRRSGHDEWAEQTAQLLWLGQRSRWAPLAAVVRVAERDRIIQSFGADCWARVLDQVRTVLAAELAGHELIGVDDQDGVALLLRGTTHRQARKRLTAVLARVSRVAVQVDGEQVHVTPICGWVSAADVDDPAPRMLLSHAIEASDEAGRHLDLIPRRWAPDGRPMPHRSRVSARIRTAAQIALTIVLGVGLPFLALVGIDLLGLNLATPAYLVVTLALVLTSALIWAEGFHALDPPRLPDEPVLRPPPASAVIAAYLPNEADTIVETVHAFLAQDYPGPLQIVLAYNTPVDLPVESELRALAARDPRLTLLRVSRSTSKAQNVNAAMQVVTGEFTGIFDADHHPHPDAYRRAWRWIATGADVVQGHCVIRNGAASWVSRTVAVEFENIYAVSHPGRSRMHSFGLFGGSNGFWRTSVLRDVRMHGHMLTEDIDSSFRALLKGRRLVYDPGLLSRELAPTTLGALWNQRMRWAQGWFQVSRRHLARALGSSELSARNKLGILCLLGWREVYPWLSMQVIPVIAFLAWDKGGIDQLDWAIPTFVLTSVYTMSAGPAMTLFAWRLAAPEIRGHSRWFLAYLFVSALFYTELKNVISRVAQIKELFGERQWIVTPRQGASSGGSAP